MAQFLLAALTAAASFTVLGPGTLAPANAGVLENVQALRVQYGWGLESEAPGYVVLAATEDCGLLGYRGYAIVDGMDAYPIYVVDCEAREDKGTLARNGLVADVSSMSRLGHKQAILIVWKQLDTVSPKPIHANLEE